MSAVGSFVSDLLAKPVAMRLGDVAVSASVDGVLTTVLVALVLAGALYLGSKAYKEHFGKKK